MVTPWRAGELRSDEYSFVVCMENKTELIADDPETYNGSVSRNMPQMDPNDELPPVATSVGSYSTTAQNVATISKTAVPPETQIPGEYSNPTQMEIQNESNGSDTEIFSDTNSNRGEEPRSSNVGTTPTTDQYKSTTM